MGEVVAIQYFETEGNSSCPVPVVHSDNAAAAVYINQHGDTRSQVYQAEVNLTLSSVHNVGI